MYYNEFYNKIEGNVIYNVRQYNLILQVRTLGNRKMKDAINSNQ